MASNITNRPIQFDLSGSTTLYDSVKFKYNFDSLGTSTLLYDNQYSSTLGIEGIKMQNIMTNKKIVNIMDNYYNYNGMYLTFKGDNVTNTEESTEYHDILFDNYELQIVIHLSSDNYKNQAFIQIPVHNYETVKNIGLSDMSTTENVVLTDLVQTIDTNLSAFTNAENVSFDATRLDLNKFLKNDSKLFMYNFSSGNDISYKFFFMAPNETILCLNDTDYTKTITNLENIIGTGVTTTFQAVNQQNVVEMSNFIERLTIPVEESKDTLNDIYIDCHPVNENGEKETVQLMNFGMNEETKKRVEQLVRLLLNIIIIFVVVYFIYYKLPKFFQVKDVPASAG